MIRVVIIIVVVVVRRLFVGVGARAREQASVVHLNENVAFAREKETRRPIDSSWPRLVRRRRRRRRFGPRLSQSIETFLLSDCAGVIWESGGAA